VGLLVLDFIENKHTKISNDMYTLQCLKLYKETCNVRLARTIGSQENYTELLQKLSSAKSEDVFNFYLSGNGGQSVSMVLISNGMRSTKAQVNVVVDGPVYSAHAFIALSGKTIDIKPGALFLFHRTSLYGKVNKVCSCFVGKLDRTVDAHKKCLKVLTGITTTFYKFADDLVKDILTVEEREEMKQGHDIVISGEDMKKRLLGQ